MEQKVENLRKSCADLAALALPHAAKVSSMADRLGKLDFQNKGVGAAFDALVEVTDVFELLCFTMRADAEVIESVRTSTALNAFDLHGLMRELDAAMFRICTYATNNDCEHPKLALIRRIANASPDEIEGLIDEVIPESVRLFEHTNLTLLNLRDQAIPESGLPPNAPKVDIHLPNTEQMMFDMRPMMDKEYIKHYGLTKSSGLCQAVLDRFSANAMYSSSNSSVGKLSNSPTDELKGGGKAKKPIDIKAEDDDEFLKLLIEEVIDEPEVDEEDLVFHEKGKLKKLKRIKPVDSTRYARFDGGNPGELLGGKSSDSRPSKSEVLEGKPGVVYQRLGRKQVAHGEVEGEMIYRMLTDYDQRSLAISHAFLGVNVFVSNVENKRLLMLRDPRPSKWKRRRATMEVIGLIKHNIKHSAGEAIHKVIYPTLNTREEKLRLLACCIEYDSVQRVFFENPRNFDRLNAI